MKPRKAGRTMVRVILTALCVAMLASVAAVAQRAVLDGPPGKERVAAPVALSSAAGDLRIGNSRHSRAVLEGGELTPGEGAEGSVRISNPNRMAFTPSLRVRAHGDEKLADALRLRISDRGSGRSMYSGSPASAPRLPMPEMKPGRSVEYSFAVDLPAAASNSLQGREASFDLIWNARAAAPPPECKLRNMRARFFIFRRKPVIRLVSRYRANVSARIAIRFYERRANGRPGRYVGRLVTRFKRTGRRWKRNRVAQRRPVAEMRRFRRSRHGYFATIRVAKTPGYCSQYLNLDLVQLRRYFGQFAWFQRGSFRTR